MLGADFGSKGARVVVFGRFRREAEALKRLGLAAGMEEHRPRLGLLIALAIAAGLYGLVWLASGAPPWAGAVPVYGVVEGLGLSEGAYSGTSLRTQVRVDDRVVTIWLPHGVICKPGDRIELQRRTGRIGRDYEVGYRGCSPAEADSEAPAVAAAPP